MKKTYMKPDMREVQLQHRCKLLAGSLTSTRSNLSSEDDFVIEETPQGVWGR